VKKIRLVEPLQIHKDTVLHYINEFNHKGEISLNFGGFETYEKWLEETTKKRHGIDLPNNRVRAILFLVMDDNDNVIGVADIKPELNENLLNFGGHISYSVRPSERNKGYATAILSLMLEYAKKIGVNRVLLICNEQNNASAKIIEKSGGVLENTLFDEANNIMVKRYWINL